MSRIDPVGVVRVKDVLSLEALTGKRLPRRPRRPRGATGDPALAVRDTRDGIDEAAELGGRAGSHDPHPVDEICRSGEHFHATALDLVAPHPRAVAPGVERRLEGVHVESDL